MLKKYFCIIDVETATTETAKQYNQGTNFPLCYDISYLITDRKGNEKINRYFIAQEIFFDVALFNTAYYKDKRDKYMQDIKELKAVVKPFNEIIEILIDDLRQYKVSFIAAYNGNFDYRALKFTAEYLNNRQNTEYIKRLNMKIQLKAKYPNYRPKKKSTEHKKYYIGKFQFVDIKAEIVQNVCNNNNQKFCKFCEDNKLFTKTDKFYSTTAETVYKFLSGDINFIEKHTGSEDIKIEKKIFLTAHKKKAVNTETHKLFNNVNNLLRIKAV